MKVEGILTALSPVHQGGNEKTGAETTLNRQTYFIGGQQEEVPIISGNGIRGAYRRRVARDFLDLAGIDRVASKRVYYLLYSGGANYEVVRDADAGAINLQVREQVRRHIPPVALLGGNLGNQPFEGALKCSIARPICEELVGAGMIPVQFLGRAGLPTDAGAYPSFYNYLDSSFATRKDDIRDSGGSREGKKKKKLTVQMLFTQEVFVPGTRFYHKWVVTTRDPVVVGCFWRGIKLFLADPYVGGGHSRNMGELELAYEGYADENDAPYLAFMDEHAGEIRREIESLCKTWK